MAENDCPRELTRFEQSCLYLFYAQEAIRNTVARQGYPRDGDLSAEIRRIAAENSP